MGLLDILKGLFGGAKASVSDAEAVSAQGSAPSMHAESHDSSDDDSDSSSDDSGSGGGDDDEADDWGGWDPNNFDEYWYRLKAIEAAGMDGDDAAIDAKAREYGLRNWAHMQRVRDTFHRHHGHKHEFVQAVMNVQTRRGREQMAAAGAAHGAIFEPIDGVTLEMYAKLQAQAAGTDGDMGKWRQILAGAGLDEAKWGRASEGWNARMSGKGVSDPNATYALLAEYGKFFGQAGVGQFGAAAAANAGGAGVYSTGGGAVGAEPCTLDRYAEIMGAQSAWSQQGRDVNAMLKSQFGMTALDFSNIGQYWSARIQQDYRVALQLGDLQQKHTERYMAAGGGKQDTDLSI